MAANNQLLQYLKDGGVEELLVKEDGEIVHKKLEDCDFLKGHCGIYFSAHWCPPCRGYTPQLAKKYDELKQAGLTVIFSSWDRTVEDFDSYYGDQPWAAIPYKHKDALKASSAFQQPSGIPSLQLFDQDGQLYQKNGRAAVMDKSFPYADRKFTMADIYENVITDVSGTAADVERLKGLPHVALYFSAHWCPPCRQFTPKLCATYKKMKESRQDFEFIFVSSDKDMESFKEYFGEMPFLAVNKESKDFADIKEFLSNKCGVQGIPHMTVLDNTGAIVAKNARGMAGSDENGESWPWLPKAVYDMGESVDGINETTSICLMMADVDAEQQKLVTGFLDEHAKAHHAMKDKRKLLHFTNKGACQVGDQVKELCKMEKHDKMIILNIPKYFVADLPKSVADIEALHQKHQNNEITWSKFG